MTIRDLAFIHKSRGITSAESAKFLDVSQRTVQRWLKHGKRCGEKKFRIDRRTLSAEHERHLVAFVEEKPDVVLEQIVEYVSQTFSITISCSTASRILSRNDLHESEELD